MHVWHPQQKASLTKAVVTSTEPNPVQSWRGSWLQLHAPVPPNPGYLLALAGADNINTAGRCCHRV